MREIDIFAEMAEPLADGTWVNSNIARIAEIIQDYDPELEIRWLPRDKRRPEDDVFQIVDKRINKVAFTVKSEADFNEELLVRIFESDMSKVVNRPLTYLEKIDAANTAAKAVQYKKHIDSMEEAQDLAADILASPLNAYTHNNYRYDLPAEDQPKKVIVTDAGKRYQKPREAPIRRPKWGSNN